MRKVLVAIDGSECSLRALAQAIGDFPGAELHLLNVQTPITGSAASFLGRRNVEDYHREEGLKVLGAAVEAARAARIEARQHVAVGEPGETIARFAGQIGAERIVIGSKGRGAIPDIVLGSAVRNVLEESTVPVLVVK